MTGGTFKTMFAVVQLPLTDLRYFIGPSTNRVARPAWPRVTARKDFVRSFGGVVRRPKGGAGSSAGEDFFSTADRALRFASYTNEAPNLRGEAVAFRRLMCDGVVTTRIEIGFRQRKRLDVMRPLGGDDFLRFVDGCLRSRLYDNTPEGPKIIRLARYGDVFATRYLAATTALKQLRLSAPENWWLEPGLPLTLLEYRNDLPHVLPKGARKVSVFEEAGIQLHHYWDETGNASIGVWFLGYKPAVADVDKLRRLRLHLLRLHAERECLNHVLNAIQDGKLTVGGLERPGQSLDEYLDRTSKELNKEFRFGVPQAELLNAYAAEDAVEPDKRLTLMAEIEKLRPASQRGLERLRVVAGVGTGNRIIYVDEGYKGEVNMTSISFGDNAYVVNSQIAGTIKDSFNRVAGADVSDELAAALKEYLDAVTKLTEKLPDAADQAVVAKQLDTLTREATADAPDKDYIELAVNKIESIASKVADLAPTVISIGKKLLPLLAL